MAFDVEREISSYWSWIKFAVPLVAILAILSSITKLCTGRDLLSTQYRDGDQIREKKEKEKGGKRQSNNKLPIVLNSSPKKIGSPTEIRLPKLLKDKMNEAWRKSFKGGKSQEQGGILVRNSDGSLEWIMGKTGTSDDFMVNYGDIKSGQTLMGVGHTHPYNDHDHSSFSGTDLARFVGQKEQFQIVQSENQLFLAERTQEFDNLVNNLDSMVRYQIYLIIKIYWDSIYNFARKTNSFSDSVEIATRSTCLQFHLLYYSGNSGKLRKRE